MPPLKYLIAARISQVSLVTRGLLPPVVALWAVSLTICVLLTSMAGHPGRTIAAERDAVPSNQTAPHSDAATAPLARPIELAHLRQAQQLLVANRDSASLATIDLKTNRLIGTWKVPDATQLSDLLVSADEQLALVCSATQNRVWLLQRQEADRFTVLQTLDVPAGPVELCWLPGERQVVVSCQWGRQVQVLKIDPAAAAGSRLKIQQAIPVTHTPRRILPVENGQRVIVADQFSGVLSVISIAAGKLERTVKIPGQNVHGLALSANGQQVILAHQILNQVAETTHDAVFWGIVMSNTIRVLPLKNLLDPNGKPLLDGEIHFLGQPNHGAGDPTDIKLRFDEILLTTLGGTDELAVGVHLDHSFDRVKVGRRPVAVVADPAGKLAYVANQFSDSISIVNIPGRANVGEISLHASKPREATPAELGEAAFYDSSLSLDGWYSCHSCHSSGHTVGLLNDNLGDGDFGAPKRIPSLLGLHGTAPFLWSGRQADLQAQVKKSIVTTMQGDEPDASVVEHLTAFLETLPPPPKPTLLDAGKVARGAQVFETSDCGRCHTAPVYTSPEAYDVGIADQRGQKRFNPPSLRGVRFRGPFFHDHRAESLPEVFLKHQHPNQTTWTAEEVSDLVAFLESL